MPVVTIESWPMDEEKKPIVIKKITEAFGEIGIPKEAVTIILHENKKENFASAGKQHSEKSR